MIVLILYYNVYITDVTMQIVAETIKIISVV